MFRNDRTNPSGKVGDWKGGRDLARGNPSTKVSDWMNGVSDAAFTIAHSGGNYYEYGGNTYVVFTGAGTITTTAEHTLDILVCGGGGSGGYGLSLIHI